MNVKRLIIIILLSMLGYIFIYDYTFFFWGQYLPIFILSIVFIVIGFYILKVKMSDCEQWRIHKLQHASNQKRKKKRLKSKREHKKHVLAGTFGLVAVIGIGVFLLARTFFLTLDLPYVLTGNYKKTTCVIEESKESWQRGDTHSQYIVVKDLQSNKIIKIDFRHEYERIYPYRKYNIWYLPNSHLGYKAELIN